MLGAVYTDGDNEITMQTSAEVNLKKWKAIVHNKLKTKPAIWTVPEWDAIRKDKYT